MGIYELYKKHPMSKLDVNASSVREALGYDRRLARRTTTDQQVSIISAVVHVPREQYKDIFVIWHY